MLLRVYIKYIISKGIKTFNYQTRACIKRLNDVILFFSDQEITWSGVVYVYLLGTDHLISDVRLSTPLLAPCI